MKNYNISDLVNLKFIATGENNSGDKINKDI